FLDRQLTSIVHSLSHFDVFATGDKGGIDR
ncbi:MAG: hypothetical protein ACI92G_002324, partial [Candidatus Pelagisphaera sp.]